MTYRELYAQNCQRDAGKTCHIGNCPDTWLADLTKQPKCKINCPPDGVTTGDSSACARCWDQQIPDGAPLPEWAKAADAEIRISVRGDTPEIFISGSTQSAVFGLICAIEKLGEAINPNAPKDTVFDEFIKTLQDVQAHAHEIWDFSEGGGGDAEG